MYVEEYISEELHTLRSDECESVDEDGRPNA